MSDLTQGKDALAWKLDAVREDLRDAIALFRVRERAERQARTAANGAVYRKLATGVLEPARLERDLPLSNFAAAAIPQPEALQGRDWIAELYECPADTAALSGQLESSVRLLQAAGDQLRLLSSLLGVSPKETRLYHSVYRPALLAAIDRQTVAEGKEFVPQALSGRAIERVGLALTVAEAIPVVSMTSDPYRLSGFAVLSGRARLHGEQTGDTGQTGFPRVTPGTRDLELSASKMTASVLVSTELNEDALLPLIDGIETEISDWLAAGLEDALINGDVSGTHQDSDVTEVDDPRKAWAGLRKLAPAAAKTDAANAVLTAAMLRANRKKMGRLGALPGQIVHVVSASSAASLAADSAFRSVADYGPHVVDVLPGEVGRVDGSPVLASEYVRQDLNATGVDDGVTTNRSLAISFNRRALAIGQRRAVTIAELTERFSAFDQRGILASLRVGFGSRLPASEPVVALHYNLAI
jgi:hypothetical protein